MTNICDALLITRWARIKRHLTSTPNALEYKGQLAVDQRFYIAKNSTKFRLKSHLDWAYYTPKTLAQAIDNGCVDSYYEIMLSDVNSDPNLWKDQELEQILKSYYAARIGRASLI